MECKATEQDRIENNLQQPQSMYNYTKLGFHKLRAPPDIMELLQSFWHRNKEKGTEEEWGTGNTYTNNWKSKSYMVSVEDTSLRGAGNTLKDQIWTAAETIISEWTGQQLTPCSLYGIRVYTEGAILAPHVDRLPLVSSAIINVDQDVDEPWPLEVIGHDGKAYNVTMNAGDMVLYESHSVIHGRPFPLKGRYMANIFVHFEPTGHTLRHHKASGYDLDQDVNAQYRASIQQKHAGHENKQGVSKYIKQNKLPPYVIEGTPEASIWRQTHREDWKEPDSNTEGSFTTGSTTVHQLARNGELDLLKEHVANDASIIHTKDTNGFTPLHEGVLGGHVEVVRFLIEQGADYNAKTNNDNGGTALWWANKNYSPDHPMIEFLQSIGAADIGPEL